MSLLIVMSGCKIQSTEEFHKETEQNSIEAEQNNKQTKKTKKETESDTISKNEDSEDASNGERDKDSKPEKKSNKSTKSKDRTSKSKPTKSTSASNKGNQQSKGSSNNKTNSSTNKSSNNSNKTNPSNNSNKDKPNNKKDNTKSVTISIRCDTILKNKDKLQSGLESYVPSNGVILGKTKFDLKDNENVFDILVKAVRKHRIHMEYQGASQNKYGSVYVQGINNLYEFSCGDLSGWMYNVNGSYPNVGCDKYILKDGDNIEWRYTCDLGRDLGVYWLNE